MTKKIKISATFADGKVITRTTARTYTHAYLVKARRSESDAEAWGGARDVTFSGFAGSYALAVKGAAYYTGAACGFEHTETEIVEVK